MRRDGPTETQVTRAFSLSFLSIKKTFTSKKLSEQVLVFKTNAKCLNTQHLISVSHYSMYVVISTLCKYGASIILHKNPQSIGTKTFVTVHVI